jgi:hypothetical protein
MIESRDQVSSWTERKHQIVQGAVYSEIATCMSVLKGLSLSGINPVSFLIVALKNSGVLPSPSRASAAISPTDSTSIGP